MKKIKKEKTENRKPKTKGYNFDKQAREGKCDIIE